MDFNLKKLEQLNDIISTGKHDLLLVNVEQPDGTFVSKSIKTYLLQIFL